VTHAVDPGDPPTVSPPPFAADPGIAHGSPAFGSYFSGFPAWSLPEGPRRAGYLRYLGAGHSVLRGSDVYASFDSFPCIPFFLDWIFQLSEMHGPCSVFSRRLHVETFSQYIGMATRSRSLNHSSSLDQQEGNHSHSLFLS